MNMLPAGIIPSIKEDKVYDFTNNTGHSLITSYYHLNRNITLSGKDITLPGNGFYAEIGEEKERTQITSIATLKSTFGYLITAAEVFLMRHTPYIPSNPYTRPDFSGLKKDLLIEQLIFDVLFDKYLHESRLMTRNSYSHYMAEKLYPDDKNNYRHTINERLTRGMTTYHDRTAYSKLSDQIKMLGVDPEKYVKYYNPRMKENSRSKKPKFIWDLLYYNFGLDLTYRQYRRQLTRGNRNYSYEAIVRDLKSYNDFVTKLLPVEFESFEKYFRMSMDYYVLESYKRVDFIFKLIEALAPDEIATINRNHFLVSRFVPCVLVPYIQDGELHFDWKYKYYRPLFIIEDMLLKELPFKKAQLKEAFPQEAQVVNISCERYHESQLKKYQHVRAKAYELFKYHYEFCSSDYKEIKQFLRECYDMRTYHHSNTFWNLIRDSDWEKMDNNTKQQLKDQIRSFLSINDAFFWKSSDRDYTKPETDN